MILVTGAAGFIGSHLVKALCGQDETVIGIDCFRDYYSVDLKRARYTYSAASGSRSLISRDLSTGIDNLECTRGVDAVIHLAAQPGVRLPPHRYADYERDNIAALAQVLTLVRQLPGNPVLMLASSSSVYGDAPAPFVEDHTPLIPNSYYGTTKLLGEQMARSFAEQSGVPTLALRFFTAYGPWGRPDMAYMRLISAALGVGRFSLFGDGLTRRDFTFVDDIVTSIVLLLRHLKQVQGPYFEAVNIGGGRPVSMLDLIELISAVTDEEIPVTKSPPDPRDARVTEADFTKLMRLTGQVPHVPLEEGVRRLVGWASEPQIRSQLPLWMGLSGRSD